MRPWTRWTPPLSPIPLWPARIGCENHIPYHAAVPSEQVYSCESVGDYSENMRNNILELERVMTMNHFDPRCIAAAIVGVAMIISALLIRDAILEMGSAIGSQISSAIATFM